MPKGKRKYSKISKKVVKLWLPTAGLVILMTVLIWGLTESYNKQIIGQSAALPRISMLNSGFIPSKKVENTHQSFNYFKSVVSEKPGNYSIYVQNLNNGTGYDYKPSENFYAASLYKVPVAVSTFMYITETSKTLDDTETLLEIDFSSGTGVLGKYSAGTKITYRELIETLLKESDNTSQSILLRVLPPNYLAKGFTLNNEFSWGNDFLKDNQTGAYYYAQYMGKIYNGNYLNKEHKELLFKSMEKTSFDDRVTPFLREGTVFSHKIGSWGDTLNWHDCGILTYNSQVFSICVMSNRAPFETFKEVSEATAQFVNSLLY